MCVLPFAIGFEEEDGGCKGDGGEGDFLLVDVRLIWGVVGRRTEQVGEKAAGMPTCIYLRCVWNKGKGMCVGRTCVLPCAWRDRRKARGLDESSVTYVPARPSCP